MDPLTSDQSNPHETPEDADHLRFHRAHEHMHHPFGNDAFARRAEAFARFFGTPLFLGSQSVVVLIWMGISLSGLSAFDPYPFILLNLAFSLQAAYAAPLILLAQTRQADRDKATSEADARHREAIAMANQRRQRDAEIHSQQILQLLEQNTQLTEVTKQMSERIEMLTSQMHSHLLTSSEKASTSSN
ncbi:DUF1003 domain-containing protein [Pseudomonas putida]|jgi:uncharacterized membrane protein|uniref:DUF1003 domain-containing protein n=1 Tax=Pseudomonas putida TaxID=303 RepID=UPI0018D5E272|nr:DUF1003 domain-containing protein [Pseudomonas putida]MBH3415431.1 DUF1003 domain-containing protein [Pseudomonas putida]MDG9814042.1 DUF1003 domain-containing protein [Pseudomonas putida]